MPSPLGLLRASFYSGIYEVSLILDKKEESEVDREVNREVYREVYREV